jgi:hypothetical protein
MKQQIPANLMNQFPNFRTCTCIPITVATWMIAAALIPQGRATTLNLSAAPVLNGPYTVLAGGGTSPDTAFPSAAPNTQLFVWDGNVFTTYDFDEFDLVWYPQGGVLVAGNGFFIKSPNAQVLTYKDGIDPTPPALSLEPNKYYLLGSINYGPATYEDVTGGSPSNHTAVLRFVPGGTAIEPRAPPLYTRYLYTDGVWSPTAPVLNPLEAVFIIHPYLELTFSFTHSPPGMVLTWPRGKLQASDGFNGPWEAVPDAQSPYPASIEPTTPSKFYRVEE